MYFVRSMETVKRWGKRDQCDFNTRLGGSNTTVGVMQREISLTPRTINVRSAVSHL
jgi:hypothetical protein